MLMNLRTASIALLCAIFVASTAQGQVTIPLPNRTVNKLLPDYLQPRVYALNQADGTVPGTLLALNSTNGAILGEIPVNLNPTDMAMTPAGDAIYVINAGSRTISKVNLNSFAVVAEKNISTPNAYNLSNPLHLAVGRSNLVYFRSERGKPDDFQGEPELVRGRCGKKHFHTQCLQPFQSSASGGGTIQSGLFHRWRVGAEHHDI